jgi:2'-5' RNA ligase
MRLFFALWPDPETQQYWYESLANYVRPLGGRREPAVNLHLTLAFLGEVSGTQLNTLLRLGDDLPREPFTLRLNRIDSWKKQGLACLRPADEPGALLQLLGRLQTGLQQEGFAQERRTFKPHVTLSRQIIIPAESLPVWPVLEWQVPAIALVRSELSPAGSRYHVVGEWRF